MVKETILVVEDEEDIQNLIKLYLEREYNVLFSADGPNALQIIQEKKPDLILLDILLPGMNGLEVCEKLREFDKKTPVFLLSANRDLEKDGLASGADDYLTKPFDPAALLAKVKDTLPIF